MLFYLHPEALMIAIVAGEVAVREDALAAVAADELEFFEVAHCVDREFVLLLLLYICLYGFGLVGLRG